MLVNTRHRTDDPEIMDNFDLKGDVLIQTLDKIARINQLLGGNRLTIRGVEKMLEKERSSKLITIVDVGCGNGDMLRRLADLGIRNNWNLKLIGVDANAFTINYAAGLSEKYSNISYRCEDIFDESFNEVKYDIVLCTLTLHHFKNEEIFKLLALFNRNSRLGFVVNDLHRNVVAYRLFQMLCFVFRMNGMAKKDGLVSILRGFKKEELIAFSKKLSFKKYSVQWKWAFRYQWIVEK
ncbi:methyltransferase domain-containing protein [Flavobacterium aquiphilum]|uniref:methyltransferase domain-containing protein n=1 Tax=Flavobacterium aquiphilum TaxID=3003261 RepID=UPI00247FB3EB|nr:methyltransferase domain-containing protein [Flavobacterium aquiphilum]